MDARGLLHQSKLDSLLVLRRGKWGLKIGKICQRILSNIRCLSLGSGACEECGSISILDICMSVEFVGRERFYAIC